MVGDGYCVDGLTDAAEKSDAYQTQELHTAAILAP